uniref:Uncharacterized protein n=1 Tax=Pelodiscus sinensis TaxID=13735 RepID=K7EXP9_PELSI
MCVHASASVCVQCLCIPYHVCVCPVCAHPSVCMCACLRLYVCVCLVCARPSACVYVWCVPLSVCVRCMCPSVCALLSVCVCTFQCVCVCQGAYGVRRPEPARLACTVSLFSCRPPSGYSRGGQ